MKYDFDRIVDRANSSSIKWDYNDRVFGTRDVLPMWVADMDFTAPDAVIEGIQERAAHGFYGYTERPDTYYQSITDWMQKRHGWKIRKEWMLYSPGVVPSLSMAVMAFTGPEDSIVVQCPVYGPFLSVTRNNGRQLLNNPLKLVDGKYEMDFDDLEVKLKSGAKMMLLCNPHNPGGRVWTKQELTRVGELCLKNNVLLVSDEIHCDIVLKGHKYTPVASLSEEIAGNTITCIAPSKTFNIAGLSTSSVIIANKMLYSKFKQMIDKINIGSSNIFGITASEMAYTHGAEWLDQILQYLEGNVDFLLEYFRTRIPHIKPMRPEGTYLVWLDCRELKMGPGGLKEFMIKEARVGLSEGTFFGPGGEGFQRINIACPRPILKEGLGRIEKAVNNLRDI